METPPKISYIVSKESFSSVINFAITKSKCKDKINNKFKNILNSIFKFVVILFLIFRKLFLYFGKQKPPRNPYISVSETFFIFWKTGTPQKKFLVFHETELFYILGN